jgi:hypothetical protein
MITFSEEKHADCRDRAALFYYSYCYFKGVSLTAETGRLQANHSESFFGHASILRK